MPNKGQLPVELFFNYVFVIRQFEFIFVFVFSVFSSSINLKGYFEFTKTRTFVIRIFPKPISAMVINVHKDLDRYVGDIKFTSVQT